jgi:hypothetical protein
LLEPPPPGCQLPFAWSRAEADLQFGHGSALVGFREIGLVRVVAIAFDSLTGWWTIKLGRLDEPLVVLVAGGGDLARFDGAEDCGLVHAGCVGSHAAALRRVDSGQ